MAVDPERKAYHQYWINTAEACIVEVGEHKFLCYFKGTFIFDSAFLLNLFINEQ